VIAASAPPGARDASADVRNPAPSPTVVFPPALNHPPTQTEVTANLAPTMTEAAVNLAPTTTPTALAPTPALTSVATADVSATLTVTTGATATVIATVAASATTVLTTTTDVAVVTPTAPPTVAASATPLVVIVLTASPRPTATPIIVVLPTASPMPRHPARPLKTRHHGDHRVVHRAARASAARVSKARRHGRRKPVYHPLLSTLLVWAQPRKVGANAMITVGVQVNDASARIALVARYGNGLAQERRLNVPPRGAALIRLRALRPAGCTGSIVARVYVTATTSGRALTRATTFTVTCQASRQ